MPATDDTLRFQQIHIDVARNATDDFNPFHDKHRWQNVADNPFAGPIALGFQLECLIAEQMRRYREDHEETELLAQEGLQFSNYEFKFVNAVKAGQEVTLTTKDSRFRDGDNPTLANRVSLYADGRLAVTGYKRESRYPPCQTEIDLSELPALDSAQDRAFLGDTDIFLKRKYMTTSNAKNFLCGSLVEQSDYIDEIAERVSFPEMFPCALLSCALLERASQQGHDFEREPLVYKSHSISIDRDMLRDLRRNDSLHLLSRRANPTSQAQDYECFGVIGNDRVLFRGRIDLMPLAPGDQ
jgi:hypothetical protein